MSVNRNRLLKRLFIVSGLFLSVTLMAQPADSLWVPLFQKEKVSCFEVDPLQQLLVVDQDGVLVQYNSDGNPLFRYHNTTLGEDFTIDATDPFNILLFFQEQQTIVLLDRTLSERGLLDLRNTSVQYATAIARSHDNNIWVYDELAGRLYRLSAQGKVLFTSNDLRLSEGLTEGATQLLRRGDRILLNFPQRGLALFSILGQLQEWWELPEVSDCFFHQQSLYFQQNGIYQRYLPAQQLIQSINWPEGQEPVLYRRQFERQYSLSSNGLLKVAAIQNFEKD